MIDIRWIIIPLFVISVLYWAVVNAFQSPFALPILAIVGLLIYFYVKNSSIESARQEEVQQNQVRYRKGIQYFKANTEKCLSDRSTVPKVQQSISGIIDLQERQEIAKDIVRHLRYELRPSSEGLAKRQLLKPGAEDVLKTCFEAMYPQATSESCETKAQEEFKRITEI